MDRSSRRARALSHPFPACLKSRRRLPLGMPLSPFSLRVVELIRAIPHGRVATYGRIAALAGDRRAARQVARILHSCSTNEGLPWHRVVNKEGGISLDPDSGGERQQRLLEAEGVRFGPRGRIDLREYLWVPSGRP